MLDLSYIRDLPGYQALTVQGVEYVENVLGSPPARAVGQTSLLSVSGSYAAARFPYTVDYESRGCEKPFVLTSILRDEIVDIWPQPYQLSIVVRNKLGRRHPRKYVADYIEYGKQQFALIEAKKRQELERLSDRSEDWVKDSSGIWRFLPGESIAKQYGMSFRVFCPEDFPKGYLANLEIIARLPSEDLLSTSDSLIARVRERLERGAQTVLELCKAFDGLTGAVIYQAIARGKLFGLLNHQHLGLDFLVYATRDEVQRHEAFIVESSLRQKEGAIGPLQMRLLRCSANEMKDAIAAQARYDSRRKQQIKKDATDYRDDRAIQQARAEGASRLAGFLRRTGDRGKTGQILNPALNNEIKRSAEKYLAEGGIPKTSKMYAAYQVHADQEKIYVPAPETYRKFLLAEMAPERAAFLSGGRRAFHAARPRTDGLDAVPRLEIAGLCVHIDGVYGDVLSKPDEEGLYLRPIIYPMIDDSSGFVFGRGVKVGRPSRMPVAMAHRDCFLRHGFLPAQVFHDWGSEFVNEFVPEMQAYFNVGYERRPSGAPRFGGMSEMFNAQLSSFLQNLVGGMYFDKAGRSADGSKKGRKSAEMGDREIIAAADEWMFKTWNETPIGSASKSPKQLAEESLLCFPQAIVKVADDLWARYFTSLPLRAKAFSYRNGYRYGGENFTSSELVELLRASEKPEAARLDCMDPSSIHVLTKNGPITLRSLQYNKIQGLDFCQRMEHLRALFNSRSTAKSNQMDRNLKEAQQLQAMRKIAAEAPQNPAPAAKSPNESRNDQGPDFSGALKIARQQLLRLNEVKR